MGEFPPSSRSLPRQMIEEMVELVREEWDVLAVEQVEAGRSAIYRIIVESDTSGREYFLKAAPNEEHQLGIDTEARVMAVVDEHTSIPVPEVIGVVDEHRDVRTPFFLMESMAGS